MNKKVSLKSKKDLITNSMLSRLTDFQIETKDKVLENWCEDLRELIVNFEDNKILDHCEKCGCNEFLCGHNKR